MHEVVQSNNVQNDNNGVGLLSSSCNNVHLNKYIIYHGTQAVSTGLHNVYGRT